LCDADKFSIAEGVFYDHLDAAGAIFGMGSKWEEFMAQGARSVSYQHHSFRILQAWPNRCRENSLRKTICKILLGLQHFPETLPSQLFFL